MTYTHRLCLWALCALMAVSSSAQAGMLDRLFGRETAKSTARAQSSHEEGDDCFCQDCDHNYNPEKQERCAKMCGNTYYPAMPPYCAPCWGVYPTCWRRGSECWTCPQVNYSTKPGKKGMPPAPRASDVAKPYVTSPRETRPEPTPVAVPKTSEAAVEVEPEVDATEPDEPAPLPPQSRRAFPNSDRPLVRPVTGLSAATKPRTDAAPKNTQVVARRPEVTKSKPAPTQPAPRAQSNKSIEELLRDLE